MAIEDLYVEGATGNPLNTKQLPATRPTIAFPAQAPSKAMDQEYAKSAILFMFIGGIVTSYILFVSVKQPVDWATLQRIIACVSCLILVVRYISIEFPGSLIYAGLFLLLSLAAIFTKIPSLLVLSAAGTLHLFGHATSVRTHHIHLASAGTLPASRGKAFRESGVHPPWITPAPLLSGLWDAVVAFSTYNRKDIDRPGVWRSPIGNRKERVGSMVALSAFITLVLDSMFTPVVPFADGLQLRVPGVLGIIVYPVLAVSIWFLVLALTNADVAGAACALRRNCYSPNNFPEFVSDMSQSEDELERNSIWLGNVDYDRSPILYLIEAFFRHAWIVGKTGSGKTSYFLFLLEQLSRRGDLSIVYIDLKATQFETLATLRGGVKKQARDVKFFTLDAGESSYLFDLFNQVAWKRSPTAQRAALILSALSLSYAQAYAQSWFRDAAYTIVHYVLTRHPDVRSWRELEKRIEEAIRFAKPWELPDAVRHDGVHVQLIVKRLASIESLNPENHPAAVRKNAIEFTDCFKQSERYYIGVGAIKNDLIAGEVGRLLTTALLKSAAATSERKVRTLLFIDEWQCMVTTQLSLLLEQARSQGVGVVLSNQTTAQMITPDGDMRPIVEGNTSLQAWLQITDDVGREQLRRLGGQEVVQLTSKHCNPKSSEASYTYSEHILDRVTPTLTSKVGSEDQRFFLRLTDNVGYACYDDLIFVARSYFHMFKRDYEKYCKMPWPRPTAETLVNPLQTDEVLSTPAPPVTEPPPPAKSKKLGRPRPKKTPPQNPPEERK